MFLKPLLRDPSAGWMLLNADTGAVLARRVVAAVDSETRKRGLLGRDGLDDEALIIAPCNAIHTFFMRFSIDVAFTDREGRVTRCVHAVRPWRITGALRGFATIELASGTLASTSTIAGHRVLLQSASMS